MAFFLTGDGNFRRWGQMEEVDHWRHTPKEETYLTPVSF